jgi:hypothetical protein
MKHYCKFCNKYFTREWNLKRHNDDVHEFVENAKNDNVELEFKENFNYLPNNNSSAYPFYNEYNNMKFFPESYIESRTSETRAFTLDDKLVIQKN